MPQAASSAVPPHKGAVRHADMANAIRALAMDAVQQANSGHPGMPMGMADVATVLFSRFLKFDPQNPTWPDRDRFVLSAFAMPSLGMPSFASDISAQIGR